MAPHRSLALAVAALTATITPASGVSQPRYLDGIPDPINCERLGYRLGSGIEESVVTAGRVGSTAGRPRAEARVAPSRPSFAAPPPPPPPPPPSSAQVYAPPGSYARILPPLPVPPVQRMETERYPNAAANPIRQVVEAPVSTFSVDVDTASYANVRRFLSDGIRPPADAVRVEELINYFDYGYAPPQSPETPFSAYVAVAPSPWSAERQILHIGLQGYDVGRREQPPLNLVFLIDTSGSMQPIDRLPLAQKSLNLLIDQLRPQDRVAMVAYAGSAGAVLGSTDGRQKLKMRCALQALGAGGSTAGGQGLALAYALARENFDPKAINRVILLTDGDFNVGVADPAKLKDFVAEKRKDGVYLSVYGFGRGNYNDVMMQTLAQAGNGTAAYVDTLQEARKLFDDDFSGSLFPIADDVKIQVEFNPARVAEYRLIGYETRLLNREDFNNDAVDAGDVGAGHTVTAIYEITPVGAGAPSVDARRYGSDAKSDKAGKRGGLSGEWGFLKIRYKLPDGQESKLLEQPINKDMPAANAAVKRDVRFSTAVAGFAQLLRGGKYTGKLRYDDIIEDADGALDSDSNGRRAEFVQLVRKARTAKGM